MRIGNILGVYLNNRTRIVGLHRDKSGNLVLEVMDTHSANHKRTRLSADESKQILEDLGEL